MTDKLQELDARGTRLLKLRNMLAAREGRDEYKENVVEIKREIARLENRPMGYDL